MCVLRGGGGGGGGGHPHFLCELDYFITSHLGQIYIFLLS